MKCEKLFSIFLSAAIIAGFSACQKSAAENAGNNAAVTLQTSPTISPTANPTIKQNSDSAIRKIDFNNFSYPFTEIIGNFTLENGNKPAVPKVEAGISLDNIEYIDLTNDGKEEAVLQMGIETGGSSMPSAIFIYTVKNDKSKLLWNFVTGDRAKGGLKKVYAENGNLIVELFGDSRIVNKEWSFSIPEGKDLGAGNPILYTKNRFKWNGEKFVTDGDPELFDYDYKKESLKNQQK